MEDGWTWHPSKRGDFSVRSAYFLAMEERKRGRASTSSDPTRDVWKKVWQLHLPPKIKIFAWKIMHDSVQTKLNLLKRGMGNVDPICPMCGECEESMVHCFFECTEAVVLWRVSSLRLDPSPFQGTSLARRIVDMSSLFSDPKWWNTFWSVMWGIWLRRNAWLLSGKRWRLVDVADKAMSIVGEFEITKQPRQSGNNSATAAAHWKAPLSAFTRSMWMWHRAVARDHEGDVMLSTCMRINGVDRVDVGEALAARHGLQIAYDAGLRLITALQKRSRRPLSLVLLFRIFFYLASMCNSCQFSHVRKIGNSIAHYLAKLGTSPELVVWMEEVPQLVQEFVNFDLIALNF
ncbi:hypothetical protein RDABS01_000015 [Bienertia sinuspersici]